MPLNTQRIFHLLQREQATNKWWDLLTRDEQKLYVQKHPHTHMRVTRRDKPSGRAEDSIKDKVELDESQVPIPSEEIPSRAEMIQTVDRLRVDLGISRKDIKFSTKLREFVLDGKRFYYAGGAVLSTGKVTLYQNRLRRSTLKGVVIHEFYHVRYERFLRQLDADRREGKTPATSSLIKTYMETTGDPQNFELMSYVDGVSEYSKKYWMAFHKGDATWPKKNVLHETLAEMGRLAYQGYGIHHEWLGPLPRRGHTEEYPNGFATTEGIDEKIEEGARLWMKLFEAVEVFNAENFKAKKQRSRTSTTPSSPPDQTRLPS